MIFRWGGQAIVPAAGFQAALFVEHALACSNKQARALSTVMELFAACRNQNITS
jgi:hypothetical protein